MSARSAFEYTILRVLPRVERLEFMNVGVILICRQRKFLAARVALDEARLRAFAPWLDDATIAGIADQLALVPRICAGDPDAGPIAQLTLSERWHWLAAPASTIVQPAPAHTGLCVDPEAMLNHLFATMVACPTSDG